MIPKILHIIWIGPHLQPVEMIQTWADKHSGDRSWFFQLWTKHDQDFENQDQINARFARQEFNGAADVMRYSILAKFGGFAIDADSECVKALDEGPEDFLSSDTAVACFESETARPGMVACGFLGAPKGHPFFQACVEEAGKQDPSVQAWRSVGPLMMTRMAQRHPDQIKVYPSKMFIPQHYSGAIAPGNHPVYAKQYFGSTKGYNSLRKRGCTCSICSVQMTRCPWG